ncbi:hypothetical protein [Spongiimicrobium salis]|uniref:hypothetical protein n=1 Tax=Spongiimicrobium salis TaxID=1667022 RepID=UPI00374D7F1F
MDKLDYSISLREKGLSSEDIKKKMKEKGFEDSEILYYLKKSDKIFLDHSINYRRSKSSKKYDNGMKMIGLALSLILLIGVFFGYVTIGLLGLFFIWSLIGYSSYRK